MLKDHPVHLLLKDQELHNKIIFICSCNIICICWISRHPMVNINWSTFRNLVVVTERCEMLTSSQLCQYTVLDIIAIDRNQLIIDVCHNS